jgi:DNA polymerase IV
VYDAGVDQVYKGIQAGHKTLDDLRAYGKLTRNQRIRLEYYDDFNPRIPREQITSLGNVVKKTVAALDPELQAIIRGSYRRGADTSGDIDFIIIKPGTSSSHELMPFLDALVGRLTRDGFLVAALAAPRTGEGSK